MASYNNKQYNTRHSNRYNTPGQFVSAGENTQQQYATYTPTRKSSLGGGGSGGTGTGVPAPPAQPPLPPNPPANQQNPNLQTIQTMDVEMKQAKEDSVSGDDSAARKPFWIKNKLQGVKKISNKERRRRQNENLRKLLSPKNALMVLNEMLPNEQLTSQFKVEPAQSPTSQFYTSKATPNFCADLTVNGQTYKGYGENKLSARNVAAEQAIRDLILQKMNKMHNSEINAQIGAMGTGEGVGSGEEGEDTLPMIQLASYALHKLFAEWEYDGHKVPQLKPPHTAQSSEESESAGGGAGGGGGGAAAAAPRTLPANAADMHPCMLVAYMRSDTEYRDLAVHGDKPQNLQFTIGLDIDGQTFIGKAPNKKEARKQAARVACESLFGVKFNSPPPLPPPAPHQPTATA